jgi:hypothetical protein
VEFSPAQKCWKNVTFNRASVIRCPTILVDKLNNVSEYLTTKGIRQA